MRCYHDTKIEVEAFLRNCAIYSARVYGSYADSVTRTHQLLMGIPARETNGCESNGWQNVYSFNQAPICVFTCRRIATGGPSGSSTR